MNLQAARKTALAAREPLLQEQEQSLMVQHALKAEYLQQPRPRPLSASDVGFRLRQQHTRLGVVQPEILRYSALMRRYQRVEDLVHRARNGGRFSRKMMRLAPRDSHAVFNARNARSLRGT